MWQYVKYLFQLLLAPSKGWEDVSASAIGFDEVVRRGYIPLIVVTALSEFIPLAYVHSLTFLNALGGAIAIGAGMFASLYAARLFLEAVLTRFVDRSVNAVKVGNLAVYMLGLDCFYRIFSNLLPATLTFLAFLPLISIVVLFKSATYLGVDEERIINYLVLGFTGVVIVPFAICWMLSLII